MYFAPTIFKIAGFADTNAQMWGTVIVGITNVLATFIAIAVVDKLARKPIMYAGFVTMGLAMITVGMLFNMGIEKHPELEGCVAGEDRGESYVGSAIKSDWAIARPNRRRLDS
jgi:MFS transporter, SP family, galactose:H+ symporter